MKDVRMDALRRLDPSEIVSEDQMRAAFYEAEIWFEADSLLHRFDNIAVIVSFDEINELYNDMMREARADGEEEYIEMLENWPTVFDYLRDTLGHGLHPVELSD